jgi:YHS domain-containing protein
MLKNITLGLIICCGIVLTVGRMLLAEPGGSDVQTNASLVIKNQEAGNKICPVSGEKINQESKAVYGYKSKIYNLCCSACIEKFRDNPEKYVKIVEEGNNK